MIHILMVGGGGGQFSIIRMEKYIFTSNEELVIFENFQF